MQVIARSCSCVAIVLMGLTAPAMAHDRAIGPVVPAVAVPKTAVVPAAIPSVAARALVPAITPVVSHPTSVIPATNAAVVVPAVLTTNANPNAATATPRLDVMPRAAVISEPRAGSKLDVRSTHEATKALTTRGQSATGRDAAVADGGGETKFAASSTGAVTDAAVAAEPAPSQSRPVILPSCR